MTDKFDLTAPQTAIWLDHVFFSDKPIYNTGQTVAIDGELDRGTFCNAVQILVQECDSLRLALVLDGETARQETRDLPQPEVEWLDFSSSSDPLAAARPWIEANFWKPLAWNAFPLFHFALIKLGHNRHLWVQKYHHLVIDAIGRQLVTKRAAQIYEALRDETNPPPSTASPFAAAAKGEESYLKSERYTDDRDYWLARFASLPNPLIEGDRRQTERSKSGRPGRLSFRLGRKEFARLEGLAKSKGSTSFKLIVALVYVAFSRLYQTDDIAFGIPLSNRAGKFKETVGLFAQIMPFRIAVERKMPFAAALNQIDKALTKDYAHRRFPIAALGSLLHLSRLGRFGLYDVSINYVPTDYRFDFAGSPIRVSNISSGFFTPWAITIADLGAESGLDVTVDYDAGLIDAPEAARLTQTLEFLLLNGIEDFDSPIGRLAVIAPEEREFLLAEADRTRVDVPKDATLASLLADQAARTPAAIAAVHGRDEIDYATLHARAGELARTLAGMGVGPDKIVGIALPRSIDLLVAVMGIHLAGGAYLPLDPAYPAERIAYIVAHARAPVIITTEALAKKLPETEARLVLMDALQRPAPATTSKGFFHGPAQAHNLAYVIYTSGSTGLPKGVGVEHRNVVNLIFWGKSLLEPDDLTGMLFSTSLNFDLSAYELFTTLAFGGRLIISENLLDVASAPRRDEIRLINTVPSLLDALLKVNGCPASVRTVNVCGEPLTRPLADRLFAVFPNVRFFNFYGPTETTIYSTWYRVPREERCPPPIGKGLWNTAVYVLDSDLELVPNGTRGELYIGGRGVARGYLNAPDLTDQRFIQNPHGEGRIYRTGDIVRSRGDGELEYVGRADGQVKINGLRVELGEIEAHLASIPGISAAACVVRRDKSDVPRLLAYAIAAEGQTPPSFTAIRERLEHRLPRHMIPSSLMWIASLPLTPNGKLDRRALPDPAEEEKAAEYLAPRNDVEERLAAIWRQLLKAPQIGVREDFFESGGDSLQATLLILKINEVFGITLPAETVFGAASTIEGMAHEIENRKSRAGEMTSSGEAPEDIDLQFAELHEPRRVKDKFAAYYVDPRTGLRRFRPSVTFGQGIVINEQGYRGPNIRVPKPPHMVRIAFLGSSRTFDTFAGGNDATWPDLTCQNLRKAFPDAAIDYVNGSQPAYNTRQLSVLFREYISAFEPDVAVIWPNDLNADSAYLARSKGLYQGPHFTPSALAKKFPMWARIEKNATVFARLLAAQNARGKAIFSPGELTASFEKRLGQLVRVCQKRCTVVMLLTSGVRLRRTQSRLERSRSAVSNVFFMPYMSIEGLLDAYEAYDDVIRKIARLTGAVVIDAEAAVPGDGVHFIDSGHFREAGSRRMAAFVAQSLMNEPAFQALVVHQRVRPLQPAHA